MLQDVIHPLTALIENTSSCTPQHKTKSILISANSARLFLSCRVSAFIRDPPSPTDGRKKKFVLMCLTLPLKFDCLYSVFAKENAHLISLLPLTAFWFFWILYDNIYSALVSVSF